MTHYREIRFSGQQSTATGPLTGQAETARLLAINLPKWPALLVEGASVTPEQAAVVILRTDSLLIGTNDHAWKNMVYDALGIVHDREPHGSCNWKSRDAARLRFRSLDLNYLDPDRIASSFIGGPYGWIDWNGDIGRESYNIGKWPSVPDVFEDWQTIATAFPFLSLRAQLCDNEATEDVQTPLIEFRVEAGAVAIHAPGELIRTIPAAREEKWTRAWLTHEDYHERGCTLEQLRRAIELTEASLREEAP